MANPASLQFQLLREIFDLARKQHDSIEHDDLDAVLELMEERETLIERVQRVADESAELPGNVVRLPGAEDHARQDAIALDTVIRGILEHDRRNEELLLEKMQAIRDELPRLRRGRQAGVGYRSAGDWEQPGGYADRRS